MKYFFTRKLMFIKGDGCLLLVARRFRHPRRGFRGLDAVTDRQARHDAGGTIRYAPGKLLSGCVSGVHREAAPRPGDDQSRGSLAVCRHRRRRAAAAEEILRFYRRYHSMRYVRSNLVCGFGILPDETLLDRINAHLLIFFLRGGFRRAKPCPRSGTILRWPIFPAWSSFDRRVTAGCGS